LSRPLGGRREKKKKKGGLQNEKKPPSSLASNKTIKERREGQWDDIIEGKGKWVSKTIVQKKRLPVWP